jgi:glutamyl-tRNA synthetase
VTTGRFAPSPSGPLHLGNLRTALLAWCFARSENGALLLRVEDLTTSDGAAGGVVDAQLADLAAIGITHDGPVERQSDRRALHDAAVQRLVDAGVTYECFCSRREIREAADAPHGPSPEGAYPGTCRDLSPSERDRRRAEGRTPAVRLRAGSAVVRVQDRQRGSVTGLVDDLVLRRADGVAAYNLAVVVDDADQGVDQVVRGADLLETTPRQVLLQELLGLPAPTYAHVPLVLGPDRERLAKRHGAVTLADRAAAGEGPGQVVGLLARSLGLAAPGESLTAEQVLERFDPAALPLEPWVLDA